MSGHRKKASEGGLPSGDPREGSEDTGRKQRGRRFDVEILEIIETCQGIVGASMKLELLGCSRNCSREPSSTDSGVREGWNGCGTSTVE